MRPSQALAQHRNRVQEIARMHHVSNVRLFGSVLRGEDGPGSDIDLLVEPTAQTSLMDIGAIRVKLKALLGCEVDVVTPNALPAQFREQVVRDAVALKEQVQGLL
jgi:uncharacterized protein